MNKSFVFWYEDDIKFSRGLLCDALKDIRSKGKIEDIVHSKAAGIGWAFIYWESNKCKKDDGVTFKFEGGGGGIVNCVIKDTGLVIE